MTAGLLPAVASFPDTHAVSSENGELTSNLCTVFENGKVPSTGIDAAVGRLLEKSEWPENGLGMYYDIGC